MNNCDGTKEKETFTSKNINIELATANPLFNKDSHLPAYLQCHLTEEEQCHLKYRQDVIQDIAKNNNDVKCITISFKRKKNVIGLTLITVVCWIVFLLFSISNSSNGAHNHTFTSSGFITQSPIAYMFASFQFTFVLFLFLNRYFEAVNADKKETIKFKIIMFACFIFSTLLIALIAQFDIKMWSNEKTKRSFEVGQQQVNNIGACVLVDVATFRNFKSNVLKGGKLQPPFTMHTFSQNMSLATIDAVVYNIEKFVLTLINSRNDARGINCNQLVANVISFSLFQVCDNSCNPVNRFCEKRVCDDLIATCFSSDRSYSDEEKKLLSKRYENIDFNSDSPYYKLLISALKSDAVAEWELEIILKTFMKGLEDFRGFYNSYCANDSDQHKLELKEGNACLNAKNYTIYDNPAYGNCRENHLKKLQSQKRAINSNDEDKTLQCTKSCFYISLMTICNVIELFIILYHFVAIKQSNSRKKVYDECAMTLSGRLRVFVSGFIPILIGVVLYQYGYVIESSSQWSGSSVYIVIVSHIISSTGFYQGVSCLLSGITGLSIVQFDGYHDTNSQIQSTENGSRRNIKRVLSIFESFKRKYELLFDFEIGVYFFEKMIILEIVEITMQYLSLEEICISVNPNKEYIQMAFALLLLNAFASPLLMNFRHFLKQRNARYIVFVFDSVIDALYLFNNTYRGGEDISEAEISIFINVALWYPAISIIDKMRDVRIAMAIRSQEKEFKTRIITPLEKIDSKRKIVIEKILLITIFVAGVTGMTIHIVTHADVTNRCRNELTPALYDNSYPIKLYSKGLYSPDCGYRWIERIDANETNIDYIPSIISKCTNLKHLSLASNILKTLPCRLLEMQYIEHVYLSGNPVATKLDLNDCKLNVNTFPTPGFVCKHMHATLKLLKFSNQSIRKLDRCIGNLLHLHTIDASNNKLLENGIPPTILNLQKLNRFNIDGNHKLLQSFSWKNGNISSSKTQKMVRFLVQHFSSSLKILNLDHNFINKEDVIYDILDNMTLLEHLSVANNKFYEIKEQVRFFNASNNKWSNLKSIDLSSNPIAYVSLEFCMFFEVHNTKINISNNRVVGVNWKKVSFAILNSQKYAGIQPFPMYIFQQFTRMSVSGNFLFVLFDYEPNTYLPTI